MKRILPFILAGIAAIAVKDGGGGAEMPSGDVQEEAASPAAPEEEETDKTDAQREGEIQQPVPMFLRKPEIKLLSPEEQQAVLKRRTTGAITGVFTSYAELLCGVSDVLIVADDREILETKIQKVFEENYRPTFRELFDSIGRQTRSSWSYSVERKAWFFSKPAPPLPFSMPAAERWSVEDRGLTVLYKAPNLPVGLEVYVLGRYSADNAEEATALARGARDACALNFSRIIKKDARLEDMSKTTLAENEALYFESPAPRAGHIWRQWAVATRENRIFALVSVIPQQRDEELLPQIKQMLSSFASPPVAAGPSK